MGICQICRQEAPVIEVTYRTNTGMLLMRRSATYKGRMCRGCSARIFFKTMGHNLLLGWWGTISFFATLAFIVMNTVEIIRTLFMPTAGGAARRSLESEREYALAMLATKDRATVVDVLVRKTGAPQPEVEAFLAKIA